MKNIILQGDALTMLKTLPDESIDGIMTSPPYYALRNYNMKEQLGLESTLQEYIAKLCDIFDEVKRVLKKEGTCFVNISDTYGGTQDKNDYIAPKYKKGMDMKFKRPNKNILKKSLCMVPFRFALEMVNRGWLLRNDIIWHKPNAMPSSVKDRFTVDFEHLFFFTKSRRYYFETQYVPYAPSSDVRYRQALRAGRSYALKEPYKNNMPYASNKKYKRGAGSDAPRADDADGLLVGGTNPLGRNMRTVWTIPTQPNSHAHFATYPEKLCEIPIKAGCPKGGIVLDPFFGSGTTGVVALKLNRKFIGIELNPDYIEIANQRLKPYLEQRKIGDEL